MKPDYKNLGAIYQDYASTLPFMALDSTSQENVMRGIRAAIEEYDRLRMAEVGEGMPSVQRLWECYTDNNAGPPIVLFQSDGFERVRNLMLSAFAQKLEKAQADEQKTRDAYDRAMTDCVQMREEINKLTAKLETGASKFDSMERALQGTAAARDENYAKLAAAEKRLGELEWRPVSVNPTKADASPDGWVFAIRKNGNNLEPTWQTIRNPFDSNIMHWLPFCPPPAPTAEELSRAEFEKCATKEGYNLHRQQSGAYSYDGAAIAWTFWQAARASQQTQPS